MEKGKKIHPLEGQSLLDIAVQTSGDIEGVHELAEMNQMSVTDELSSELHLGTVINKGIADYYEQRKILPATNEVSALSDGVFGVEFDEAFE